MEQTHGHSTDQLLNSGEVMAILNVSRTTLSGLVKNGSLKAYRPGGRKLLFKYSEILAYVERALVQPSADEEAEN